MKFLFIAPRYHTNQHFWVKPLIDHGHEVRFWVWNQQKTLENYSVLTPELLQRSWFNLLNPILYYKKIMAFNPDIVIIRDPRSYLFAFISLFVARLQGRKIIIYSQTSLYQKMTIIKGILANALIRLFNAIWITPVKGDDGNYEKFHTRAFYIPFAIEPSREEGRVNDDIRIISVGKLYDKKKNHLLLLEAIRELYDAHLTIIGFLRIYGQSYFHSVQQYIAEYGLGDRVRLKSSLSHEEMLQEYGKYDIFVIASSEPISYSVLEAMSRGLPVICSDKNGARWYVEEGENGYVFKSGDREDLYAKIYLLISNRKKLQEMKHASRHLVETQYTPDLFYQRIMHIVDASW